MALFTVALALSTVAVSIFYLVYRSATKEFGYFKDQGIPGPKPTPFVGNMWGLWRTTLPLHDLNLVRKYGKVFGFFDGPQPKLWVTDPELIKSIFVRDFDHFVDRRTLDLKSKVIRKMLTMMRGQEWKDVRSSITPAFTTGKIKRMSLLIRGCVDRLSHRIETAAQSSQEINLKTIFSTFTMDVISRCAFGMQIDGLAEPDNPFMRHALSIVNSPITKKPLILLPFMYPGLLDLVGDKMFMTEHMKFFISIMEDLVKERQANPKTYDDFAQVAAESIAEITKEVNGVVQPMWTKEESDEIVIAQSVIFLLAGFDTTATTLTNACYLLTKHPEVQEKLYQAVMDKSDSYDHVCHEMIAELPYAEQVVNEVLRLYPPGLRLERMCTRDVTYGSIRIKRGVLVTVPTFALHRQEDFYPDPEVFDPDRWSAENKKGINPYAFIPFGIGPRNCVGMRFALEELKLALCSLVKQFRFYALDGKTPEEVQFDVGYQTVLQPMQAIVGVEQRN